MTSPWHSPLIAAGFDWESLLPLLFFVLYGLAQFLGAKKEAEQKNKKKGETYDEAAKAARERQRQDRERELAENTRRIQEEIRRKIAQRRGQTPASTPSAAAPHGGLPQSEGPRRLVSARPSRPMDSAVERSQLQPASPTPAPQPRPSFGPLFGPDMLGGDGPAELERALREQRELLEQRGREREAAHARALSMMQPTQPLQGKPASVGTGPRGKTWGASAAAAARAREAATVARAPIRTQVLSALAMPQSARRAVVLSEVLGPPVGLRRGPSGLWQA